MRICNYKNKTKMKLRICPKCKGYTLSAECKKCKQKTKQAGYKFLTYKKS